MEPTEADPHLQDKSLSSYLVQSFSNFSMHMDPLESLVKHRF